MDSKGKVINRSLMSLAVCTDRFMVTFCSIIALIKKKLE